MGDFIIIYTYSYSRVNLVSYSTNTIRRLERNVSNDVYRIETHIETQTITHELQMYLKYFQFF